MTSPNRFTPVRRKISFSASTDVHAGTPVVSVMRRHRRSSVSNPSQLADVPLQPIVWTRASVSSSAARRISRSSNCAFASSESAIWVTRKRPKCAVASGMPAIIAVVIGSSRVLDDGVSIPSSRRPVGRSGSGRRCRADDDAMPRPQPGSTDADCVQGVIWNGTWCGCFAS